MLSNSQHQSASLACAAGERGTQPVEQQMHPCKIENSLMPPGIAGTMLRRLPRSLWKEQQGSCI
eukprot:10786282-Ditylum_brightwellii.AAC.1